MTPEELSVCTGARIDRAAAFLPHIEAAMVEFGIDSDLQKAAFLATVGHESGGLRWLVELWGPTPQQRTYDNRMGNLGPADGFKYRGRGLIQLTGMNNYRDIGPDLGVDLLSEPDRLAEPELACRSAARYWQKNGLNKWADAGDFDGVSDVVNRGRKTAAIGDAIGYHDRAQLYGKSLGVFA